MIVIHLTTVNDTYNRLLGSNMVSKASASGVSLDVRHIIDSVIINKIQLALIGRFQDPDIHLGDWIIVNRRDITIIHSPIACRDLTRHVSYQDMNVMMDIDCQCTVPAEVEILAKLTGFREGKRLKGNVLTRDDLATELLPVHVPVLRLLNL